MSDWITVVSLLLTILGALLGWFSKHLELQMFRPARHLKVRHFLLLRPPGRQLSSGQLVLSGFAVLVVGLGCITAWKYWDSWTVDQDTMFFVLWLLVAMIGGMFVQVLSSNYRQGNPLFDVDASRLIYPLLFALVVFYPIWALLAEAPRNLFAFYAAFLNGFFWETVVANAKLPNPQGRNGNQSHEDPKG